MAKYANFCRDNLFLCLHYKQGIYNACRLFSIHIYLPNKRPLKTSLQIPLLHRRHRLFPDNKRLYYYPMGLQHKAYNNNRLYPKTIPAICFLHLVILYCLLVLFQHNIYTTANKNRANTKYHLCQILRVHIDTRFPLHQRIPPILLQVCF